jgi:ribonuclease HI
MNAGPANQVTIYTRGVSSASGGGGYGTVLLYGGQRKELSGALPDSSNNRMDIVAAIEGLKALKWPCRVMLYNTNTYLIDGIAKDWARCWRAHGWINDERKPTRHAELWEELLNLCSRHEVTFVWLQLNDRNKEYARCDLLAHEAVQSIITGGKLPKTSQAGHRR